MKKEVVSLDLSDLGFAANDVLGENSDLVRLRVAIFGVIPHEDGEGEFLLYEGDALPREFSPGKGRDRGNKGFRLAGRVTDPTQGNDNMINANLVFVKSYLWE